MTDSIRILGARGSTPVGGAQFARFGGQTVCCFLRLGGEKILLDAGSGMMQVDGCLSPEEKQLSLLLTHPHADHMIGLPLSPVVLRRDFRLDVYAAARGGLDARAQVCALLAPPLWPVGPEQLPADFVFHPLPERFTIGSVTVESTEGLHPGGVSLLRLRSGGRSVVFATDCTLREELLPRLTAFAADCDLLLIDGQYSEAEWKTFSGFGHSTWAAAARFGARCGAKHTLILHHDPRRTDDELEAAEAEARRLNAACSFARAGTEFIL